MDGAVDGAVMPEDADAPTVDGGGAGGEEADASSPRDAGTRDAAHAPDARPSDPDAAEVDAGPPALRRYPGPCTVTETDDEGNVSQTFYTYDDRERLIRFVSGTTTITHTYSGDGLTETIETFEDGQLTRRSIETSDAAGRLVRSEVDSNLDGAVDLVTTNHYQGEDLIEIRNDFGADGTIEFRATYTYDARHRPLTVDYDTDGDGDTERRGVWRYGGEGRDNTYEQDDDLDGQPDSRAVGTFNALDLPVRVEVDLEANGTVESTTTWTYDEVGNILTVHSVAPILGNDGTTDVWEYGCFAD